MAKNSPSTKPIVVPPDQARWEFDHVYNFRLRRIKGGSFHGLWELCLMDDHGDIIKTLSDADALNYCIENLQGELETDGF